MTPTAFIFGVLGLVVIGTGLGMLVSRSAVYSALFLVVNFATVALIYLVLGAPFIALTQVTVYAGAIMVLFLFVIMLLGAERLPGNEPLRFQRPLAAILTVIFLIEAAIFLVVRNLNTSELALPKPELASPTEIGMALFTKYSLPFEITSVILLVAVIGAIILTRGDTRSIRKELLRKDKKEASTAD